MKSSPKEVGYLAYSCRLFDRTTSFPEVRDPLSEHDRVEMQGNHKAA
jgi:hypothetical protein